VSTELDTFHPDQQSIANYLGLDPRNPATHAVVAVCQRYDLDPVLKHVIVIPKGGVYITRDGLLHVAHRSGQLDGIVVEQEPTLVDGEWIARVSVYRKDMRHPFTFPGRYSATGSNRQYAQEMAMKAAEAHALRRAFDINGIPALDEQRPEPERQDPPAPRQALRQALGTDPQTPRGAAPSDVSPGAPTPDVVEVEGQAAPTAEHPPPADPITDKTRRHLFALLNDQGITDAAQQRAGMSQILGREVTSRSTLTEDEGRALILELEARAAAQTQDGAP
jgi:hypothetical protein